MILPGLCKMKQIKKFLGNEEGLTAVEYAIAGGMIGASAIAAFYLLGIEVDRVIGALQAALAAITAT